jgi:hypothetical protein
MDIKLINTHKMNYYIQFMYLFMYTHMHVLTCIVDSGNNIGSVLLLLPLLLAGKTG